MNHAQNKELEDQIAQTYVDTVENVIVNMLEDSGATEIEGDNIMENLKTLGGHIKRLKDKENIQEFIILFMGDEIKKVVMVWLEGLSIKNVEITEEEMKNLVSKES